MKSVKMEMERKRERKLSLLKQLVSRLWCQLTLNKSKEGYLFVGLLLFLILATVVDIVFSGDVAVVKVIGGFCVLAISLVLLFMKPCERKERLLWVLLTILFLSDFFGLFFPNVISNIENCLAFILSFFPPLDVIYSSIHAHFSTFEKLSYIEKSWSFGSILIFSLIFIISLCLYFLIKGFNIHLGFVFFFLLMLRVLEGSFPLLLQVSYLCFYLSCLFKLRKSELLLIALISALSILYIFIYHPSLPGETLSILIRSGLVKIPPDYSSVDVGNYFLICPLIGAFTISLLCSGILKYSESSADSELHKDLRKKFSITLIFYLGAITTFFYFVSGAKISAFFLFGSVLLCLICYLVYLAEQSQDQDKEGEKSLSQDQDKERERDLIFDPAGYFFFPLLALFAFNLLALTGNRANPYLPWDINFLAVSTALQPLLLNILFFYIYKGRAFPLYKNHSKSYRDLTRPVLKDPLGFCWNKAKSIYRKFRDWNNAKSLYRRFWDWTKAKSLYRRFREKKEDEEVERKGK